MQETFAQDLDSGNGVAKVFKFRRSSSSQTLLQFTMLRWLCWLALLAGSSQVCRIFNQITRFSLTGSLNSYRWSSVMNAPALIQSGCIIWDEGLEAGADGYKLQFILLNSCSSLWVLVCPHSSPFRIQMQEQQPSITCLASSQDLIQINSNNKPLVSLMVVLLLWSSSNWDICSKMLVMSVYNLDFKINLLCNFQVYLFPVIPTNNLSLSLIIFSPGWLWQFLNWSLFLHPWELGIDTQSLIRHSWRIAGHIWAKSHNVGIVSMDQPWTSGQWELFVETLTIFFFSTMS